MTEYTTSPQAIREYMTSRERTAYWVQSHEDTEFYSPSAAPTVIDDWIPSSPMSVAESSNSVPPTMVLRWGNGIPDIPIPNIAETQRPGRSDRKSRRRDTSRSRSPHTSTNPSSFPHNRGRAGSHSQAPRSPLAQSFPYNPDHYPEGAPQAPEEIRVLPSHAPLPSSSSNTRSKSLPRSSNFHAGPPPPGPMPRSRTPFPNHSRSQSHSQAPHPTPSVPFTAEPWHQYNQGRPLPLNLNKQAPAIIYAPSSTSSRPHYAPPQMYHHPPQMGANGMIYSHSAPVHSTRRGYQGTTSPPSHAQLDHVRGDHGRTWDSRANGHGRDRAHSLSLVPPGLSPDSSSSSTHSRDSGSTYYVLPSPGQKVHVIVSI
ncbi:hypothetical protein H0H81_003874 [Sphagnurus paluster]|uniref:Uncharacterized protein n=1 Tax=Sphagnurus paluster TaxID=117069 RepID=A0A9P7KH83_9AGAR|nr:hypothetical protein H0H81_003874 [Sphagnurus paluster]